MDSLELTLASANSDTEVLAAANTDYVYSIIGHLTETVGVYSLYWDGPDLRMRWVGTSGIVATFDLYRALIV